MTTTDQMLREAQAKLKEATELIVLVLQDERMRHREGKVNDIRPIVKAELAHNQVKCAAEALNELNKMR